MIVDLLYYSMKKRHDLTRCFSDNLDSKNDTTPKLDSFSGKLMEEEDGNQGMD